MSLPTIHLGAPGWTLRDWRVGDAVALAEHADHPAVWRNMSDGFPHPYTLEIAQHWVARGHVEFGGDNWAIAHDDQVVGGCGVNPQAGFLRCNAEIGYWLATRCWGRGIGTRVAGALTAQAFARPEVMRVFAGVHAYNPASIRVLERCGFVREGLLRVSALKAGTVIDRVLMARYRPGAQGGVPTLPTLAS